MRICHKLCYSAKTGKMLSLSDYPCQPSSIETGSNCSNLGQTVEIICKYKFIKISDVAVLNTI